MEYTEFIIRIKKISSVIESCITQEQINVGKEWCKRYIDGIKDEDENGLNIYLNSVIVTKQQELHGHK